MSIQSFAALAHGWFIRSYPGPPWSVAVAQPHRRYRCSRVYAIIDGRSPDLLQLLVSKQGHTTAYRLRRASRFCRRLWDRLWLVQSVLTDARARLVPDAAAAAAAAASLSLARPGRATNCYFLLIIDCDIICLSVLTFCQSSAEFNRI